MTKLEQYYGHIKLTPEEEKEAILQAKIAKYFRDKNAEYWKEKEDKKPVKEIGQTL